MTPLVRFAPSPTGYLHVGNARTALVNFLFTRKEGGGFLLRIDDTDAERSRPEYEEAIREDLAWLGLQWDECVKQSSRFDRYREAAEKLKNTGWLYACYETAEELDVQRKMLAGRGLPPVYNRAGLTLSEAQRKAYEAEGRRPHWRFKLEDHEAAWDDLVRGRMAVKASHMSDPVLIRADGVPVYTLASVVDDGELSVTHVIRGEDHVSNTAVQVQLAEALGFQPPRFAHLALLRTGEGELSKRLGGHSLNEMRQAGILPMTVNSYLARIGTSDAIAPVTEMKALIESFSFSKFGRAPANYDFAEMEKLNVKLLRLLPFAAVSEAIPFADEHFWLAVRPNIKALSEVKEWWHIANGDMPASSDEAEYLSAALRLLPPEPWDAETWGKWTKALAAETGRAGKALFQPLRLALTGMEHGPEMKALLPLLGPARARARLSKK